MTGFTACVFRFPNRVSLKEAFEVLEPDEGKLSCPVLRGPGPSNGVRLPGATQFARPPGCSHRCGYAVGQPGLLHPGRTCFVASARTGYASRPL